MKISTLKDLKSIIQDIPDSTLEGLHFGLGEGAEDEISLVAEETGSVDEDQIGFPEVFGKYPDLLKIDSLIHNIVKYQRILDSDPEELQEKLWEEGVTSENEKSKTNI